MTTVTHPVRRFARPLDLLDAVGQRLGESRWHQITQAQVDGFAQVTGDDQWIHTDVERAGEGPYGGTIAHGFLVLSLVPPLLGEVFAVDNLALMVNAGVEGVRFSSPVPVGADVRLVVELVSAQARARGAVDASIAVSFELSGHPTPVGQAQIGLVFRPARPVRTRPGLTTPPPPAAW
jgi:acyl dehydratase